MTFYSRFYTYDWHIRGEEALCYCFDENNAPSLLIMRGYQPNIIVSFDGMLHDDAVNVYKYISFVLSQDDHCPVSYDIIYIPTSVNITKLSCCLKLLFSTWAARSHCINLVDKKDRLIKSIDPYKPIKLRVSASKIDPVVMFLADMSLKFTGWISAKVVKAHGCMMYDCNVYDLYSIMDVHQCDIDSIPNPLILSFDIECYSSNFMTMPKSYIRKDKIFMISLVTSRFRGEIIDRIILLLSDYVPKGFKNNVEFYVYDNEILLINGFAEHVKRKNPDIIVGYNIFGFDLPYMIDRMELELYVFPDISRVTEGYHTHVTDVAWESSAFGTNKMRKVCAEGRIIMDLYPIFKRRKDLESVKLSEISKKFLNDDKLDLTASSMFQMLSNIDCDKLSNIVDYCLKDSELVISLIKRFDMWITWTEESGITYVSIDNLYTRGVSLRVVNQMYMECHKRGIAMVVPTDNHYKFEGAQVFQPSKTRFDNVSCVDFISLYPSIMIQYNICVSTYYRGRSNKNTLDIDVNGKIHKYVQTPIGIMPGLLKRLLEERKKVKQMMSDEYIDINKKLILNERQAAIKVFANSVYGVMGAKDSSYTRHCASGEVVTYIGRCYVSWLRKYLSDRYNVDVPYGDTDSCYLTCNTINKQDMLLLTKNIVNELNKILPHHIKIAFEAHYDTVVLLTKKKYVMVSDGKITYKGVPSVKRDYCEYAKTMYNFLLQGCLCDNLTYDEILCGMSDMYLNLLSGNVNMEKLIITKSTKADYKSTNNPISMMTKRLKLCGAKVIPGTRLQYVFVDTGRSEDYQGNKIYTPDEVKTYGMKLDYKYYIERHICKPLSDLAKALGYNLLEIAAYTTALSRYRA